MKLIVSTLTFLIFFSSHENQAVIQEQARLLLAGKIDIDSIQSDEVFALIRGGDIIGNGGGLVEIQFQNAFSSLAGYISQCLEGTNCAINPDQVKLLKDVRESMKSWPEEKIKLIFLSGQKYPDFFSSFGASAPRTAITGTRKFSPIFVNTDHIYDQETGLSDITYSQIIGLIFHEVGHHHGIREHNYLDRLGQAIGRYVTRELKEISTFLFGSQMKLMAVNRGPAMFSQLWWMWGDQQVNFTPMLMKKLKCPRDRRVIGHRLSNLSWERSSFDQLGWQVGFNSWVTISCEDNGGAIWEHPLDISGKLQIGVSRRGAFPIDFEVVVDE